MGPAFAHWLGIRPWELDLLTPEEARTAIEWIKQQQPKPRG